jgi:hypothetical protein
MLYVWQRRRNKRSRSIGAVFKAIRSNGRIRDRIAVAKPNSHASGDALLFAPPASIRLMIPGCLGLRRDDSRPAQSPTISSVQVPQLYTAG